MPEPEPERTRALGTRATVAPREAAPGRVSILLYRHGHRDREAETFREARAAAEAEDGLMAWVNVTGPNRAQLDGLARAFDLPRLAVEDAIVTHQRPKAEFYRDVLFIVLRPADYDREHEKVEVGEVHLFVSENFVLTVRHTGRFDPEDARGRLEPDPQLLSYGPPAVVHTVLDMVVDAYAPAISGLQEDIDEVENQVFDGDPLASRRTYRLAREVILLQRAVDPLGEVLRNLMEPLENPGRGGQGPTRAHGAKREHTLLRHHLRGTADRQAAAREHVDGLRQLLQNIMSVNDTLINQSQNEAMKKVSSWGGILIVPSLIASFYGMNIYPTGVMHWVFSWPVAVGAMSVSSVALYVFFRYRGWL